MRQLKFRSLTVQQVRVRHQKVVQHNW